MQLGCEKISPFSGLTSEIRNQFAKMPSSTFIALLSVYLTFLPSALGAYGSLGVDSPSLISAANFATLNSQGYIHFVGQYYDGSKATAGSYSGLKKGINANGVQSIINSDNAPSASTDALHVPLYAPKTTITDVFYWGVPKPYSSTYVQARAPIDYMNARGGRIGRTFILISQSAGSKWSATPAQNVAFMTEFLSYFPVPLGPQLGIITNQTDFQAIFGSSYVPKDSNGVVPQLMLTSCNGNPNLDGPTYTPFNGFQDPLQVKQYNCNVQNLNGFTGVTGDQFSYY